MDSGKKGELIALLGAFLVHLAVLVLLILITLSTPTKQELGGVPVVMGNVDESFGMDDPSLVDVDIMTEEPSSSVPMPQSNEVSEQELITQNKEKTIALKTQSDKKKNLKKNEIKSAEQLAQEREIEANRLREEKVESERKKATEATKRKVAGAFGKGSQMFGSKGSGASGEGVEGSRNGNSATGAKSGSPGYGTFNLGGRSIGEGGLPMPIYNVQEEGRVVVSITVNPAGHVVSTSISRQTNTVNSALRKAAEDAAKRARFNSVDGVNNQTGTITYYFKLK